MNAPAFPSIKERERDVAAADAWLNADTLANADALRDLEKRAAQLTEIYRREMTALIEGAANICNHVDLKDEREYLTDGLTGFAENSFNNWSDNAERMIREG